jgi:hypothetical protein
LKISGCDSRIIVDYFAFVARPGASAPRAARRRLLCLAQAHRRLLRIRRASGCLGTSRGSSPQLVARLIVDHFTSRRLVVDYFALSRLVVDYFAYAARLGASARRAARRVGHRQLLRLALVSRRLLHLRRASGCFGTSCGSSRGTLRGSSSGSSSTTSPTPCVRVPRHVVRLVKRLVVDYFTLSRLIIDNFAYAARPGASARRAARRAAHRRLLCLA